MTVTANPIKPSAAIAQAAALGTPTRPADGCRDCNKRGLAILPVVPTVAPNTIRSATAELKRLDRRYSARDLNAHWMVLRTLPAGYLYMLKPDNTWDAYVVDADGLFRMIALAHVPASPGEVTPMSQACQRSGDNIPAQVIAVDPDQYAAVWLAFSRYRWTDNVRAQYVADSKLRNERMTKLDVMAAANGSLGASHDATNAVRNGLPMEPGVGTIVADYASATTRDGLNRHLITPIRDREAQSGALVKKMAEISRDTAGKTGAIIALEDHLGVTIETNALRNLESGRMAEYVAEHQRARFVGDVILGFEKAFEENGHAEDWNERYAKHYDEPRLAGEKRTYEQEIKQFNTRIDEMSNDVATLNGKAALEVWWHDFDPQDDQSARDRQDATAACLHGAVKTEAEQTLWDTWLAQSADDPYATLWGAVTALEPTFGAFMLGKKLPDTGKINDMYGIAKDIRSAREQYHELLQKRARDEALALLGLAMTSQLARIRVSNPTLYQVAGLRVLMTASVRTSVTLTPVSVSMTHTQQAYLMAEATFGPPTASLTRLRDVETVSNKRVFVVGSNGVDAYAFESSTTTAQRTRRVVLWLPEEIATQAPKPALGAPGNVLALPGRTANFAPPRVNHFAALLKFTRSAPGAIAWVGLALQTVNIGNAVQGMGDEKVDTAETAFGLTSGVLGITGAMAEIMAGSMGKMALRYSAVRVAQVSFVGGVAGGLAALAGGVWFFVKAGERSSVGDIDASQFYAGSGAMTFLSGLAAIGGSLAAANAAGALTGSLAFLASAGATAATIPVWGWIAAGVIFAGIGVALLWRAIKNTDTPMEEWLKGSYYGKGPERFTPKREMDELNAVVFAMEVEAEWSDDAWEWRNTTFYDDFDNFRFSISLPGVGANSVIDCKVTLLGTSGATRTVFHETIRPRIAGSGVFNPHVTTVGPASPRNPHMPRWIWWSPPRIENSQDNVRYAGQLKLDDDLYQGVQVEIVYHPDIESMPNFVLPGDGQRILIDKD